MEVDEQILVELPAEIAEELLVLEPNRVVRRAPGVRGDPATALDVVRLVLEIGGGATTLIVNGKEIQRIAKRIVRAAKRRGKNSIAIETTRDPRVIVELDSDTLAKAIKKALDGDG